MKVDFEKIFDSLPINSIIVTPNPPHFTIVKSNPQHKTDVGRKIDYNDVGKNLFEEYPNNSSGMIKLRDSLLQVMETKKPVTPYMNRYDILIPDSGGMYMEKYWSVGCYPILDSNGEVELIGMQAIDITDIVKLGLGENK